MSDPYNNSVTYDEKWETEENKAAYEKLDKKYFDRSYASPSCPTAWAPEVLELLETLDKELGIERNTRTLRAYYPQGSFGDWFFKSPIKDAFSTFKRHFFEPKPEWQKKNYSLFEKLEKVAGAFTHPIGYGFRCIKILHINPILNRIFKPKLALSQLKEKYGRLTIYFNAPEAFEDWVNNEIRKTTVKLAMKGAYYPIESLWDASVEYNVGTEYEPDVVDVERGISSYDNKPYTKVRKTVYRKAMKDVGLNLQDIEMKAMLAASKKDNDGTT